MEAITALDWAGKILKAEGRECYAEGEKLRANFADYAPYVAYVAQNLHRERAKKLFKWNNNFSIKDWAIAWRHLYDNYADLVRADPMMFYRPMNRASEEFHKSLAFIRYFRAGNRTSKTQSGYAEHYFWLTGQHRWRGITPAPPNNTFIIGLTFAQYKTNVFERKLFTGEKGNPLAPMFPVGGKWLHHYDERARILYIACPQCANAGKAQSCQHTKSTMTLYSDDGGWEVLQGAQYSMGHFDEHIEEDFYNEAWQRLAAVRNSSMLITGTPLFGMEAWETRRVAAVAEGPPEKNRLVLEDKNSPPLVSLHQIDQFEAGIVPHDKIYASMRTMDEFEIDSRVYGKPMPLAKNPVFDRKTLAEMRRTLVREPTRGTLTLEKEEGLLEDVKSAADIQFAEATLGDLRIWEMPEPGAIYVAGIDTAAGLMTQDTTKKRDASCCSILKITHDGKRPRTRMVAQLHGWMNPFDYAIECFKLCVFYNDALAIVELTGGLGRAVVLKLKQDLGYWNIFRDTNDPEYAEFGQDSRFGVDTNVATKPTMVGALQKYIREQLIEIHDDPTYSELVSFEQERTESGLNVRYRGAGGAPDDRVMSLCIALSVVVSSPMFSLEALNDLAASVAASEVVEERGPWGDIHRELKELEEDLQEG